MARKIGLWIGRRKASRGPIFLSIPAVFLWVGVGAFLVKWACAWATGRLEPGVGTSWTGLYFMFAIAALSFMGGLFLTVMAWIGRSTVRWQVFSIVLGLIFLWVVSGD